MKQIKVEITYQHKVTLVVNVDTINNSYDAIDRIAELLIQGYEIKNVKRV